ncbi:MAG: hypothetical protein LBB94_10065 [Clostridiales bacterium]|jgi:hypothetical protein|nr:hypothetical protein [Clostridiales bacterium]
MPKASRLGIRNNHNFQEKQISSSCVLDEVLNKTVEEHMNDKNIHINVDDFSHAAFTGDYEDLSNTPDIEEIINTTVDAKEYITLGIGAVPDGSTIFLKTKQSE